MSLRLTIEGMTQPARKILPIVDAHGRITHWQCSDCSWTKPVSPLKFTGLCPSEVTLKAFNKHRCEMHPRAMFQQATKSDD